MQLEIQFKNGILLANISDDFVSFSGFSSSPKKDRIEITKLLLVNLLVNLYNISILGLAILA
jgi:hypothetical protein